MSFAYPKINRLFCPLVFLTDGWAENQILEIDSHGRISAIFTGEAGDAERACGPVIPGVPNVHSHAFQRAMAGRAETAVGEDSFWSWRQTMYGFLEKLTPKAVAAIAAQTYVEMLEAGYTAVGEFHYLHHDPQGKSYTDPAELSRRVIDAAIATGIGITHLPVLYAHSGFGGLPPTKAQRRFINSVEGVLRIVEILASAYQGHAQIEIGLAPHSLRAVTPDEFKALLADGEKLLSRPPIHVHIAEQTQEVDACLAWSGQRPIEWLLANHAVGARWCLVHATHSNPQELTALARSGAVVGLCPVTEANLGDGIFPAWAYFQQQGRFAIGSDSHVSLSPVEELRWLEYAQRLQERKRNLLAAPNAATGDTLLRQACQSGAVALGRDIGAIAVGRRADLLVLNSEHVLLAETSREALLNTWIFAGNAALVRDVYVGGRHLVSEGKHLQRTAIEAAYRRALKGFL